MQPQEQEVSRWSLSSDSTTTSTGAPKSEDMYQTPSRSPFQGVSRNTPGGSRSPFSLSETRDSVLSKMRSFVKSPLKNSNEFQTLRSAPNSLADIYNASNPPLEMVPTTRTVRSGKTIISRTKTDKNKSKAYKNNPYNTDASKTKDLDNDDLYPHYPVHIPTRNSFQSSLHIDTRNSLPPGPRMPAAATLHPRSKSSSPPKPSSPKRQPSTTSTNWPLPKSSPPKGNADTTAQANSKEVPPTIPPTTPPSRSSPQQNTSFELTPLTALIKQSYADIAALRSLHAVPTPTLPSPTYSPNTSPRNNRIQIEGKAKTAKEKEVEQVLIDFDAVKGNLKRFEEMYESFLRFGGERGDSGDEVHLVAVICKRSDVARGTVKEGEGVPRVKRTWVDCGF